MVDFKGMPLEKDFILLKETEEYNEKYLNNKDSLLLKFVKYSHPFPKKQKRMAASKFKPMPEKTYFET
jgi:hypothetical protein